jgi:hypothetical protein
LEALVKLSCLSAPGIMLLCSLCASLSAATYQVGPSRSYTTLQAVVDRLGPGDVVQVDGNATYPPAVYLTQSGTRIAPITIVGVRSAGGTRPVISGAGAYGISVSADNIVLQGIEVTGSTKGIGVFGDNIRVSDCVIHGCNHGFIGYGTGTGSVTLEYSELYANGFNTGMYHQIYMATDEMAHPGAVFRLQYCYIHNGVNGDNVKTRSERNEIYYNWIELAGTTGHGLGLFAPDPDDNAAVTVNTAREDADVVGNVIVQSGESCARIGGDTPGYPTNGRYRFVNNAFIGTAQVDIIRTFNTIETLEMYNNVIYNTAGGSSIRLLNDNDGAWVHAPRSVIGSHNWVQTGATNVPPEWTATTGSSASPFVDANAKDFRPTSGGPLVNTGASSTPTLAAYPFPTPLFPPAFLPPQHALVALGAAVVRPTDGSIDIGPFEWSSASVRCVPGRMNVSGSLGKDARLYGVDGRVMSVSGVTAERSGVVRRIAVGK